MPSPEDWAPFYGGGEQILTPNHNGGNVNNFYEQKQAELMYQKKRQQLDFYDGARHIGLGLVGFAIFLTIVFSTMLLIIKFNDARPERPPKVEWGERVNCPDGYTMSHEVWTEQGKDALSCVKIVDVQPVQRVPYIKN